MQSYRKELWFNVPGRRGFVNITPEVEAALRESGVREGLVPGQRHAHHRQRLHQRRRAGPARTTTSAGSRGSPRSTPRPQRYHHNRTGEDNADAHLKRQVMGREVVVADHRRQARLRPLGADLLRRVRRPAAASACWSRSSASSPGAAASNGTGLYPGVAGVDCLRRNDHEAMPVLDFSTGNGICGSRGPGDRLRRPDGTG